MEKSVAVLIFITVGILGFLVAYANVPLEGGPIITPPPTKPSEAGGEAPGYGAAEASSKTAPAPKGGAPGY